ncbi:hypothetical protein LCGC14_0245760 [marine sediment metagenome]|uniref:Uncharacterized protein n=1 Tax=marine sediment metagenome TaxID=412755 RepID=A0A0F9U646_9ZZZZ
METIDITPKRILTREELTLEVSRLNAMLDSDIITGEPFLFPHSNQIRVDPLIPRVAALSIKVNELDRRNTEASRIPSSPKKLSKKSKEILAEINGKKKLWENGDKTCHFTYTLSIKEFKPLVSILSDYFYVYTAVVRHRSGRGKGEKIVTITFK